jgi:cytochrome c oxidase assembly factor CtaG
MSVRIHESLHSWNAWAFQASLILAMLITALIYFRGWRRLRLAAVSVIPAWRACSFLLGLFSIWMAAGSPVAEFDEKLLTVHMIQHLLLMTIAPPLILFGAPAMPFLHGLPQQIVQALVGPVFRWRPLQRLGRAITRPAFCWFAAATALIGWHIPAAFALTLRSEAWHVFEHASFFATGLLFWWPVVRPWPSAPKATQWTILLYLFLATLPCDILSGFLVFSGRVAYPAYLSASQPFGFSALTDQECAGALMWTCVTVVYLVAAAILTMRLLAPGNDSREKTPTPPDLRIAPTSQTDPRSLGVI